MARKKNVKSSADTSLTNPQTRTEEFLAKIAGLTNTLPVGEFSRLERYLKYIAEHGGGSGDVQSGAIAPEFSATETYAAGDFVMKDGLLYEFTASHTGAWDAADVTAVNAATYLEMVAAANAIGGAGVSAAGFGFDGGEISTIDSTSASESYETYCDKVDAVLATMANRSVKAVGAKPPAIYGLVNRPISFLYNLGIGFATLMCPLSGDVSYGGWRMYKINGTWYPFEWIDPPLIANTEYRTTERFLGKPVYVKAILISTLPNDETLTIPHGIANVGYVISCIGITQGGDSLPYAENTSRLDICAGRMNILLTSNYGAPASYITNYAILKYTKTTD